MTREAPAKTDCGPGQSRCGDLCHRCLEAVTQTKGAGFDVRLGKS